ncbi:MAG: aminotransferase class V-fold PLP-dependent enzyme, partial [Acidobacteria bacterium]|nr:aminotransferase class V-fold PLP-dependent enzyme [Acidobacteriota bacterium]
GADLAKVARLPDTDGLRDEIVLPLGHDINFGAPISQMIRMSGAKVVRPGTANHCEGFHLRGALSERTAALFYVDSGDVNPGGAFAPVEEFVAIAHAHGVPLVVDMAAGLDVRPFLAAGADLVITSAHKQMGAPTSGMICGKLGLVKACYLQNYGVGRAMKVGKEGIAGCMAAVEIWYGRNLEAEKQRWAERAAALGERLDIRPARKASQVICAVPPGVSARAVANRLREGDPPVWVNDADNAAGELLLDLRVMRNEDAQVIAARIAEALAHPAAPEEDVAYHDLLWSERRLNEWPNWR